MATSTVHFLASFPAIQSAIKIGNDGMRIQLDVPESEMGNAVELLAMRECVLKVVIEPLINRKDQSATVGKGSVRKSKWQTQEDASSNRDIGESRR
jgi:hypothetical protein